MNWVECTTCGQRSCLLNNDDPCLRIIEPGETCKGLMKSVCSLCGNPLTTSRFCKVHADKAREAQRVLIQKRKASGRCTFCGEPKGDTGTGSFCAACAKITRERTRANRATRKQEGRCRQCSNGIAFGKSTIFCETCLVKHRERYKKR